MSVRILSATERPSDELLSVVASRFDLRLVFAQQLRRGIAVSLGGIERVLKRLLASFDGARERPERVAREHERQNDEDDERPDHHPGVGPHEGPRAAALGFLCEERSG
jgi:hypothetical protein